MELEQILKQLNETELMPSEIENIKELAEQMNLLQIACRKGYNIAAKKLVSPIVKIDTVKSFKPGTMERHAEVGGSGLSTIKQKPRHISTEVRRIIEFDIFEKDAFGKSPFEYALCCNDKSLLLEMYEHKDISSITKVNYNGKVISILDYFIQELSINNSNQSLIIEIINTIIARQSYLTSQLTPEMCSSFIETYKSLEFDPNQEVFKRFIKSINKENLNFCLDEMIKSDVNGLFDARFHIEMLKAGAIVNWDSLQLLDEKFKTVSDNNYKKSYEKVYKIDEKDLHTIIDKSPQVIESYFEQDYLEVLKSYIAQVNIDFDIVSQAINCPYDTKDKSRIAEMFNLGLSVEQIQNLDVSLFTYLNEAQIYEILKSGKIELSDKDVIAISKHTNYKDVGIRFDDLDKVVFQRIINYKVKGNVLEFVDEINKSPIIGFFQNPGGGYRDWDLDFEMNLNTQLKQYLELQKQQLLEQSNKINEAPTNEVSTNGFSR